AIGLDPVILLKDYKDPIREGYLSNKFLLNYNEKSEIKDLQDKYDYRLPNSSIDSRSTKMIDDVEKAIPKGLIGNVSITAKDPAFYRWHRLVDETFNPRVFSDAPNVEIKLCDLCFVFKDELVNVCPGGEKIDGKNMLKKIMHKSNILEPVATEKFVILKVFIVPEILAHDQKQWIEMDKFKVKLNKSKETIIFRAAELSSVIRKPIQKVFDDTSGDDFDNGMKFKLFVFISNWNVDKVPDSTEEGSL
ncbi:28758_t:CDS:2, partial [Gigaspora margarita]